MRKNYLNKSDPYVVNYYYNSNSFTYINTFDTIKQKKNKKIEQF